METGFYYLNARYYDPQTRGFISADDILTNKGTDVLGYNLYSYCQNSPVGKADYDGHDLGLTLSLMSVILSSLSVVGAAIVEAAVPILCVAAIGVAIAGTVIVIVETEKLKAEAYGKIADAITNAKKDKKGKVIGDEGTDSKEITRGKSRAPKTGKAGSIYEQVDNNGNVMSRTKYGENGQPEYRDDYTGRPHYDKKTGEYLQQHRHYFKYNDKGQPIGDTISPIPY